MNFRLFLILTLITFCSFCGWLIVETGLFETNSSTANPCIFLKQTINSPEQIDANTPAEENAPQLKASDFSTFEAFGGAPNCVTLGSLDTKSGFEFELVLSTKGASIKKATFSGFDDRSPENPQPLEILSPVFLANGSTITSMASSDLVFVEQKLKLALDMLDWQLNELKTEENGCQVAEFQAIIKEQPGSKPALRLTKIYRVKPNTYQFDCSLEVENLSDDNQKVRFDLCGPLMADREDPSRDDRKVVGGFREPKGGVSGKRIDYGTLIKKDDDKKQLIKAKANFLWAAVTNKYFAAIVVPLPDKGKNFCDWIIGKKGQAYDPDGIAETSDEAIGLDLKTDSIQLAPAGQEGNSKTYDFMVYLGPKEKELFDKNEQYRQLGFFHTIDFMSCCCPASIIGPLTFGILALMKWMYGFIPNYGIVIIILVFLVRIVLHPLTKKSQVSMSKFGKLGPQIEQIKQKYANNKAEMNKQMMALYKEQGGPPIMGMLPMFVQMPIWISLWSSISISIALRGAKFLPFWITDLSAPDAIFKFQAVTLPIFGKLDSFNLLPILMGIAFYLQQKLMPSQAAASTNPQAAQQQKIMMIMMPLMFPLMLYKGPSGVNLYIMASTFAGVIEQYVIKKHIREKEQNEAQGLVAATSKTGGKVKKKKPKPFFKKF